MKIYQNIKYLLVLLMCATISSCGDENVEEEDMPFAITKCMDQYFQGRALSSYTELDNGNYSFTVSNGPTLVIEIISNVEYNVQFNLISYKGDGETMPVNLAWDKLPPTLYDYISGLESLNQIYEMSHVNDIIYITLLETKIEYNTRTGKITET